MNGKKSKALMKEAEARTVGRPLRGTKSVCRKMKHLYNSVRRYQAEPGYHPTRRYARMANPAAMQFINMKKKMSGEPVKMVNHY